MKEESRSPVVGILRLEKQTKESARRDKRPSPGYCMAICFYCVAVDHMFLLCAAGPYVTIGWLWAWRWVICFYYVALGHMFLLCACMCICVCVHMCICMCVCMCLCVCVCVCFHRLAP